MERILMGHGSGGRLMHELVDSMFIKRFNNPVLGQRKDSGIVSLGSCELAFTTDSYVVDPIFFPGGDIGSLAVYGTVNDLAVCGAAPKYISLGLIIEEGLDRKTLDRISFSIARASRISGVKVVTGDTKVVGHGSCDKIFINTSGIGPVFYKTLSLETVRPGDAIILSGTLGEHAIAVLSKREEMEFGGRLISDSAPLNGLIRKVLGLSKKVRFMRDPTRGGLGTTLNEFVRGRSFGISIDESSIPVSSAVRQASELLGLDPLYLACEGRTVLVVAEEDAGRVLKAMRKDPAGRRSALVGRITREYKGMVYMNTCAGGKRIVDMLSGEQLPRIC